MRLPRGISQLSALSVVLITSIVVGAALIAYATGNVVRDQIRQQLSDRAATIAVALDTTKVAQLKSQQQDASPTYQELKTILTALKQSNRDARSIYLSAINNDEVRFIVDSEAPDTDYYSPQNEAYPEATPEFKGVFKSYSPIVEGPLSDSFGNWVSGLAPVIDLETGETVAVLGMDIDAGEYNQAIWTAIAVPLLAAGIFIILVTFYEWNRQRQQQMLRLRSELVSIASHELRTPITGMRWAAESLVKMVTDGPQKTLVTAMYDSIMNLSAGTEDILQLSRITRNKDQDLRLEKIDLAALVNEICKAQSLVAQKKGVTLQTDESWQAKPMLMCDPQKMRRALHNVISNAVKYTRDNTTVKISYAQDGKFHTITVVDEGIGIPKDEQSRVFAGFYRASNAKALGVSGTGLGLYLTKTIVEQHRGRVSFESQEGKGTVLSLRLPL